MSSQFYIYLQGQRYLMEYITNHFGDPVRLSSNTPEAKLLRRFIDKTPDGVTPFIPSADLVIGKDYIRVELMYNKEKDPREYNYLHPSSQKLLLDYFEGLMENNMASELLELSFETNLTLVDLIYAWCEKHGISNLDDDKSHETIRQKFYRLRKNYKKQNCIKLC